ncbi:MAG: SMC-Scp complex subunit ScpB [Verrucomicrobia bacterium]|nr:MAG: SMC-Scp complex subunit ScpB [Verrucomicrobiota bacterium]
MAFDLTRVLRALLFASPGPLTIREIQTVISRFHEQAPKGKEGGAGDDASEDLVLVSPSEVPSLVTASQIREAMGVAGRHFKETNEVFRLQETHQGYRLVTATDSADWVRLLHNAPKPARLSRAALETLAIVAYRQPVVRSEIESIRGVSADNALSRLLERELIRVIGRADLPGRPLQYGTTDAFLELVGVRSLEELPASDVLSSREIDDWLRKDKELHPLTEHEIGLSGVDGDAEEMQEVAPDSGHETEEKEILK